MNIQTHNNPIQQFVGISDPDQLPLLDKEKFQHMHLHIFWKDMNNRYCGTNDQFAIDVGLKRGIEIIDYQDRDFWPDSAEHIKVNDSQVLADERSNIFLESATIADGSMVTGINHKAPWYSSRTNKLLGIMGLYIVTNKIDKPDTKGLTARQIQCLYYLVKGNSFKEIGRVISLSPRTVEHYIDAAKVKLDCVTRSDLIGKALKMSVIKDKL